PLFVLDVEGGDAFAVLVGEAAHGGGIGVEAVAAGVEADHIGNREGALGHGAQAVAHGHILPVAGLTAAHLFRPVDGVDFGDVLVRVGGRLDVGVFALGAGGFALGEHRQHPVGGHHLAPLVDLDVAVDAD